MLTAFTASLLLITISELGDKSFFIAAILAMSHARRWVFTGAIAALAVMTILSVLFGQIVALLPAYYIKSAEIFLFLGFGLKLLFDASRMTQQDCPMGQQEAIVAVKEAGCVALEKDAIWPILSKTFLLTLITEWGDRTQFATITLAAANNPVGITMGATVGHAVCVAIAVLCSRCIAARISERKITVLGGVLFLVFGLMACLEVLQA